MQAMAESTNQLGGATEKNIRLVDVEKRFGDHFAVKRLNLEIVDRELLVVLGPSGCGKSTTMNMLAGLEAPTNGEIFFGGMPVTNVPAEERNVAMVFQSIALYPNRNVQENILFALKLAGVPKDVQEQRLRDATRLLGIDRYLGRGIHQLSGGERQRVAIAKALVKRPSLFLLDEPFSNLDAEMRRELRGEIVRIHRELQTTMLFVTHDQEEALSIADRIVVMNKGELIQLGAPLEVYEQPATMWVAQFVGPHRINLFEAELSTDGGQSVVVTHFGRLPVDSGVFDRISKCVSGARVVVGVRPESTHLSADGTKGAVLPASVYTRQHLGNEILYELKGDGQDLRTVSSSRERYEIGDRVNMVFSWQDVLWFDPSTERLVTTS